MSGDVYVDIDGLRSGGAAMSAAGENLGAKLQSALDRARALSDADPAGNDATGKSFHQNYDEGSQSILENGPKIPQGISGLGVFAQNAANTYAGLDQTSAQGVKDAGADIQNIPAIDGSGAADTSTTGRH